MKQVTARIHQFTGRVAVAFIGAEGETVYLDPAQALATAYALAQCSEFARLAELRKTANKQRSISTGTMRPADLVPAFLAELTKHDRDTADSYRAEIPPAALEDDRAAFWDTDDAAEILESLFDALDSAAPEGCYFGAHPGNGSDYGFWMTDETAEELETLEIKTAGQPFNTCTIPPTE